MSGLAFGSWRVRCSLLPAWSGAAARVAEAIVGLAMLFLVAQLMGAVHLLRPVPVLLAELAGAVALWAIARRWSLPAETRPAPCKTVSTPADVAIAAVTLGVVVVQWVSHIGFALGRGMTHPDTLWYHEPFAATFVQEHSFTGIESLGFDAARWYPFNSQLVHSLGILAYGHDILSPFINTGWLVLALLAAWSIGAKRGLGLVSIAAVSVGLSLPILTATQPGQASSDIACAALLLAGAALLLASSSRPVPIMLAGLAVGMSLSTKINVAPAIAVLTVGVVAISMWQRRARNALAWTLALAVTGSFWFLRNWILSGTPLPWFNIRLGPLRLPAQVRPSAPSLAHDVLDPSAWRNLYLDGIWQAFGRTWFVIVALFFLTLALLVIRGGSQLRLIGVTLVAGFVGYVFSPLTGGLSFVFDLRYLAPILLLAFALTPLLLPSGGPWRTGALLVCLCLVIVSATMPNREQIPAWPSGDVIPAAVVVAAGAVVLCVARQWRTWAMIALVAGVTLVGFWFAQRHFLAHRYVAAGLGTDEIDAYFRNVHDANVVVFGSDGSLPMFGLDLSNHVRRGDVPTVGIGPSPCVGWRRHIGGSADYVVMMQVRYGYFVVPPESVIADDPSAHVVLRHGNDTVYAISGPLDPSACPPGS